MQRATSVARNKIVHFGLTLTDASPYVGSNGEAGDGQTA